MIVLGRQLGACQHLKFSLEVGVSEQESIHQLHLTVAQFIVQVKDEELFIIPQVDHFVVIIVVVK